MPGREGGAANRSSGLKQPTSVKWTRSRPETLLLGRSPVNLRARPPADLGRKGPLNLGPGEGVLARSAASVAGLGKWFRRLCRPGAGARSGSPRTGRAHSPTPRTGSTSRVRPQERADWTLSVLVGLRLEEPTARLLNRA